MSVKFSHLYDSFSEAQPAETQRSKVLVCEWNMRDFWFFCGQIGVGGLARWKEVDLLSHSTAWLFYLPRFSWYSIYRCNSADSDQVVVGDVWVKKRLGFFDLERRRFPKP
ncbi:hypothetical protein HPP92_017854 [Vanilla planifolia]|uniref:Uncharacterized protein n=1 Tax=Vanilla planifolia TaxID=51239 RepID=A0A835QAY9_VANPL|nr:hypothetical protein HPP92_017854 [Vanilla planifolia]